MSRTLFLHRRVPVVLDGVVSPTFENLGDLSPLVSEFSVLEIENPLFIITPGNLLDFGIQVVMPSFSALLSDSAR